MAGLRVPESLEASLAGGTPATPLELPQWPKPSWRLVPGPELAWGGGGGSGGGREGKSWAGQAGAQGPVCAGGDRGRGQTLNRRYVGGCRDDNQEGRWGPFTPRGQLCAPQVQRRPPAWVLFDIPQRHQLAPPTVPAAPPLSTVCSGAGRRGLGYISSSPQAFWEVSSHTISVWSVRCGGGWPSRSAHHCPALHHLCRFVSHFTNRGQPALPSEFRDTRTEGQQRVVGVILVLAKP